MTRTKCITFDFKAQQRLPEEIRAKMKADRAEAEKEQKSKAKNLPIQNVSNSVCGTLKHRMMLAGVYKECSSCGEKFKETDC